MREIATSVAPANGVSAIQALGCINRVVISAVSDTDEAFVDVQHVLAYQRDAVFLLDRT